MEKAFVELDAQTGAANAYGSISGGWDNGLQAITGQTIPDYAPNGDTPRQLRGGVAMGRVVLDGLARDRLQAVVPAAGNRAEGVRRPGLRVQFDEGFLHHFRPDRAGHAAIVNAR